MKALSRHRRRHRAGLGTIFAIPLALLVATIAGLVIGLTGDGAPDLLSWGLIALPLIVLAHCWVRRG